jgi:hypothetical protein
MKDDNQLLNSAMDSAEAQILESRDPVEPEETKKEVEIEGAPEVEQVEPEEKEQNLDQEAETENEAQAAAPIADDSGAPPPVFWSNEQKALWAQATPALKQVIAARELQLQQQVSRFANQAKKAEQYEQRFYSDFEAPEAADRHKAELRLQGLRDPIDELHRYRDWDRVFKADPASALYDLARKNNLQIQINGEVDETYSQQSNDPRYEEIRNEFQALKTERESERAAQKEQQLASEVNAFKSGKDSTGQPIAPFASMYAPQIDQAYQQIMAIAEEQGTPYSVTQGLNAAYEYVKSEVSKIHGIAAPKQKDPQLTIEQAKRAQDAATSVNGAPTSGVATQKPRLKGKNFNEKFDSAFDVAYERANGAR